MITVASFDNQADAHIAKGLLEAEGLSPQLSDDQLVQTDWLYTAALGGIKLQVPQAEATRARELLSQDRSGELTTEEGPDPGGTASASSPPAVAAGWGGAPRPTLVHVAALSGAVIPLGHLLGPLGLWLWQRGSDPEVDAHGREAVGFQASVTFYAVLAGFLFSDGTALAVLLGLFSLDLVLVLVAGARARNGHLYRYPFTIRVLGRREVPSPGD